MSEGYQALTEKEKEALRLIVRGHDAKSTARHLNLSVHTVNERLRDARRKLSVSSSREAARLLLQQEGGGPESLTDRQLGDAAVALDVTATPSRAIARRWAWVGGGLVMIALLAALAVKALTPVATPSTQATQTAAVDPATAAETTRSALAWLALVDRRQWEASWNASGTQFRQRIASMSWARIIESVRPPLGAVASRSPISQGRVLAPPNGYVIVRFQTRFANKPAAIETVSLEREGREWKVVGYWIA